MDSQDRQLWLGKVKTGCTGLLCYVANKMNFAIVLKRQIMSIYCMSYSTKLKKVELCGLFCIFHFMLLIYILRIGKNTSTEQVFPMVIQQDSNKSYSSMATHHQTILDYSINNQQMIHPYELDTYWLLNLLKWLLFLKWLIYGNDYLKFYNNMD